MPSISIFKCFSNCATLLKGPLQGVDCRENLRVHEDVVYIHVQVSYPAGAQDDTTFANLKSPTSCDC
jgi:hypothetical protein